MAEDVPVELVAQPNVFVDLACLVYQGPDAVFRRRRAARLLQATPEIAVASLYAAAVAGDVESARRWLDREPGLATARGGPRGWDALLYLCYARLGPDGVVGDPLAVARLLLERGADPNTYALLNDTYRFTALTGAMGEGEDGWIAQPPHAQARELATLLLDAGADPNDGQGLYDTCFRSDTAWIEFLVARGLTASHVVNWGSTTETIFEFLLGAAAKWGYVERVELLLRLGTRADGRDHYNQRSYLENAFREGHDAIVELLLRHGAPPLALSVTPAEELRIAVQRGDLAAVRDLAAVVPEPRDDGGHLIAASSRGRLDVVRWFLDRGVPPDAADEHGMTALHRAAAEGHLLVVYELVERGALLTIRERHHGRTPTGRTAWFAEHFPTPARAQVLQYLLDRTTDVFDLVANARVDRLERLLERDPSTAAERSPVIWPSHGRTPLHVLRDGPRCEALLDLLLRHGAHLDAPDSDGRTPLDVALQNGWDEAAEALLRRGATRSNA